MKICVTGKGGVGKTTIVAILARILVGDGWRVFVIDADPDANMAQALGLPRDKKITPLSEMADLIEERTGARPGSTGGIFRLNPAVEDIPEKYFIEHDGVYLGVMGGPRSGGGGCACPENTFIRTLLDHLLVDRGEAVILDMEAGIEHLGRGTARAVEVMIVVVEPGRKSIQTAFRIRDLARDLKVPRLVVVGNKVRSEEDKRMIGENLEDFEILGFLPFMEEIASSDRDGTSLFRQEILTAVRTILAGIFKKESLPMK